MKDKRTVSFLLLLLSLMLVTGCSRKAPLITHFIDTQGEQLVDAEFLADTSDTSIVNMEVDFAQGIVIAAGKLCSLDRCMVNLNSLSLGKDARLSLTRCCIQITKRHTEIKIASGAVLEINDCQIIRNSPEVVLISEGGALKISDTNCGISTRISGSRASIALLGEFSSIEILRGKLSLGDTATEKLRCNRFTMKGCEVVQSSSTRAKCCMLQPVGDVVDISECNFSDICASFALIFSECKTFGFKRNTVSRIRTNHDVPLAIVYPKCQDLDISDNLLVDCMFGLVYSDVFGDHPNCKILRNKVVDCAGNFMVMVYSNGNVVFDGNHFRHCSGSGDLCRIIPKAAAVTNNSFVSIRLNNGSSVCQVYCKDSGGSEFSGNRFYGVNKITPGKSWTIVKLEGINEAIDNEISHCFARSLLRADKLFIHSDKHFKIFSNKYFSAIQEWQREKFEFLLPADVEKRLKETNSAITKGESKVLDIIGDGVHPGTTF